jgi:fructokinase
MIIISGENVADLLPAGPGLLRAVLGGGPANTAVAAARLGAAVSFAGRFGSDGFGQEFRARLSAAGVDLTHAADLAAPSALARVNLDAAGVASYDFWLHGAADFAATELPAAGPHDIQHIGSLAAYWPPGADLAERWIDHAPGTATFDVNLRPIVLESQPDAIGRLERLVSRADLVRTSDEDLRLAYPEVDPEDTARRWLKEGAEGGGSPSLVVMTQGADGAVGLTQDGLRVHVPAPKVDVVDTVGAGDAAMGALLYKLASTDLATVRANLAETLRFTVSVAALACTKAGAYAPTAQEAEAFFSTMR